jgi:starch synthase (maltosyl-transferring)
MVKPVIKMVYPELDGGAYPVKTEIDVPFVVKAFVETKQIINVFLKYKLYNEKVWKKVEMLPIYTENIDQLRCYVAEIKFDKVGVYNYTVIVSTEKNKVVSYDKILTLIVDPVYARYSAWYEIFARSQGTQPGKSATFKDVEKRLPYIKSLGFDVLYLTPIHPIGFTHRKGPNNSLVAGPNDPGSCWAIGNEFGGHKSVHPDLGTIEDFRSLVKKANDMGIEIALDIAFQCSPDHPYVKQHPEWFYHEPDGTIKCAENPPKKYEDVYPLNFYPQNKNEMWEEMKSIIEFWISQGVKIFRVDNPHTKPTEFWQWLIFEIKKKYPETIFLSEAFTYYEKLEELAKVGFTQSYSYFTWRNTKNELIEYFLKLTQSYLNQFLRVNLFVNTPDILPFILQTGGRPAFMSRIALATTLSSVYGMYNGYELCENRAIPGKEEYLNSEKYEYKVWDWNRSGNIKDYITKLNKIRKENLALHYYKNLQFCNSTNDNVICYTKISPDKSNIIVVVVNLDPHNVHDSRITLPLEQYVIPSYTEFLVEELITERQFVWRGMENYVRLNPHTTPAYIFRINPDLKKVKLIKRTQNLDSENLAKQNAKTFFELRKKVLFYNDAYARRELEKFYKEIIIPKYYVSDTYDDAYVVAIDKEAQKLGFRNIAHAYYTTPGH